MKYKSMYVDLTVTNDNSGYALGADLSVDRQTVAIASLYYETSSKYECLREAMPVLLDLADAETVVFRGGMLQFQCPDRLLRPLKVLAKQRGKDVVIIKRRVPTDAYLLAQDAAIRKEDIIEIL